jgi:hypothetical protein
MINLLSRVRASLKKVVVKQEGKGLAGHIKVCVGLGDSKRLQEILENRSWALTDQDCDDVWLYIHSNSTYSPPVIKKGWQLQPEIMRLIVSMPEMKRNLSSSRVYGEGVYKPSYEKANDLFVKVWTAKTQDMLLQQLGESFAWSQDDILNGVLTLIEAVYVRTEDPQLWMRDEVLAPKGLRTDERLEQDKRRADFLKEKLGILPKQVDIHRVYERKNEATGVTNYTTLCLAIGWDDALLAMGESGEVLKVWMQEQLLRDFTIPTPEVTKQKVTIL